MKIKKILHKNQKRLSYLGKFSKVLGNFSGPPTIPPLRPPRPSLPLPLGTKEYSVGNE